MQRQVFMGEGRNGAATQLVGVDLRDKSDHHAVVTVPVIGEADTR
jgi:hypothetical protein